MANEVKIDIKANDKASPVLDQVRKKMNGILGGTGSQAVGLTKQMGGAAVSAALGAAGLAMSFKEVYAKVMEASYEAKRFVVMGKRFGMPAAEIAKLSRYAESAGLNVGTIGRGMLMLQRFANDGIGGATGQTKELIDRLGLTKEDLEEVRKGGMNAFVKIREAMGDTMDEGEQMAVWQELIGQRAFEMAEFLKKSPEEMAEATSKSIGMSERVIQGLASGQKAYAEFQAEISKLFGELANDFDWLFGIVGWILTAIMTGVRMLRIVGATIKFILGLVYALYRMFRYGITDGIEHMSKATKDYAATWKEVSDDVARDSKKLFSFAYDDEVSAKREKIIAKSIRSFQEIAEWNAWIKELKKDQYKLDLEMAYNDEIKIKLLERKIDLMLEEERVLREKYKNESDRLKELAQKEQERLKAQIELAKLKQKAREKDIDLNLRGDSLYADEQAFEEQKATGRKPNETVTEFDRQRMRTQAAFLKAEAAMENPFSDPDERRAALIDFREQKLALDRLGFDAQRGAGSPNPLVDSLQSIGGGGTIGMPAGGIGEAQLSEMKKHTNLMHQMLGALNAMAANATRSGYGGVSQFDAQVSVGRFIATDNRGQAAQAAKIASMSNTERANLEAESEPIDPEQQAKTRALVEKWKKEEERRAKEYDPWGAAL